jgi:hypothetical protein
MLVARLLRLRSSGNVSDSLICSSSEMLGLLLLLLLLLLQHAPGAIHAGGASLAPPCFWQLQQIPLSKLCIGQRLCYIIYYFLKCSAELMCDL